MFEVHVPYILDTAYACWGLLLYIGMLDIRRIDWA